MCVCVVYKEQNHAGIFIVFYTEACFTNAMDEIRTISWPLHVIYKISQKQKPDSNSFQPTIINGNKKK